MGDLHALTIQPNGFSIEDSLFSPTSPSPVLSNPSPGSIPEECWQRAEHTAQQIIERIQPTVASEQNRRKVIEYVVSLIEGSLGSKVFPYGSVPLKTYLPDGDIDLTVLSLQTTEIGLANDVCALLALLEREEQNEDADFEVKDIQWIPAEVKLIKCIVQDKVVDITINQLGGLCTLCFLEKVDRHIGKNHLFKRSIILVKAWCYYESRILGADHGLISTYALETMVLYIFHLFHSSLNGPLAVLYRFLDYYSKFDWNSFCISLYGPVSISSLPKIVAETPDNDGGDLLFDREFLNDCVNQFSGPPVCLDTKSLSFKQKCCNIIDPLKHTNNLGRSICRGNFHRIRSAFTFGARKLGQILLLTAEDIEGVLNTFFTSTLNRHESGQRPDVPVSFPNSSINVSDPAASEELPPVSSSSKVEEVQDGISNIQLSRSRTGKEPQKSSVGLCSSLEFLERLGYIKENGMVGDASTSRSAGLIGTASTSESTLGNANQPKALDSAVLENSTTERVIETDEEGKVDSIVDSTSAGSSLGAPSSLLDLSGDFADHMNSLQCAWLFHANSLSPYLPVPSFLSPFRNTHPMDNHYHPLPHLNINGVFPRPFFLNVHPAYGTEDVRNRGTGTYFPLLGQGSYKEMTGHLLRPLRESNCHPREHFRNHHPNPLLPGVLFHDNNNNCHLMSRGCSPNNGFSPLPPPPEKLEFGSLGPLPSFRQPAVASTSTPEASVDGRKKKALNLKNEAEFPPLGVRVAQSSK